MAAVDVIAALGREPPELRSPAPANEPSDWLTGTPMDPAGTVTEPLPSLPGFPSYTPAPVP